MPNWIDIDNLNQKELEVYAHLTEAQLRANEQLFIAETPQVIECALKAGCIPVSFLIDRDNATASARRLIDQCPAVPVYAAHADVIQSLTGYALTRGVLCAMHRPEIQKAEDVLLNARRVAVLNGIADPSNMGAIFRAAAALGMDCVLLTPGSVDPMYRKCVRVSMGSVFMIPWAKMGSNWICTLKAYGFRLAAMALKEDSVCISDESLKRVEKLAVVLGNEGRGLSDAVIAECDDTVLIPMQRGVDSLNVAAASAIAFWELRKRH